MRPVTATAEKGQRVELAEKDEKAFNKKKQEINDITEIKHFKRNLPLGIFGDASKEGLGASLQRQNQGKRETTRYAYSFLPNLRKVLH